MVQTGRHTLTCVPGTSWPFSTSPDPGSARPGPPLVLTPSLSLWSSQDPALEPLTVPGGPGRGATLGDSDPQHRLHPAPGHRAVGSPSGTPAPHPLPKSGSSQPSAAHTCLTWRFADVAPTDGPALRTPPSPRGHAYRRPHVLAPPPSGPPAALPHVGAPRPSAPRDTVLASPPARAAGAPTHGPCELRGRGAGPHALSLCVGWE